MRRKAGLFLAAALIASVMAFAAPSVASAYWVDAAVGGWAYDPSGDMSYKGDSLDLESDLGFEDKSGAMVRAKFDIPTPLPNLYFMATPMSFEGAGLKGFRFGDVIFNPYVPFDSKLDINQYDIALFYAVPLLQTASLNTLNIEYGINVKLLDVEAEIRQDILGLNEKKSLNAPVPMVYLAAQFRPVDALSLEAEVRGISFSGNRFMDYIGRVKLLPMGPVTFSVGYRGENLKIDKDDLDVDVSVQGPFIELGFEF